MGRLTRYLQPAIITVKGVYMKSLAVIKPLNPRNPDTKYVGEEPRWATQPTDTRLSSMTRAFNWYGYFYTKKEAKDFIAAYLDRRSRTRDAKVVRSVPDGLVRPTTGWLCRMSDMGLELTDPEQIKLDHMIADILAVRQPPPTATAAEPDITRPTIQDRLREKVSECAGELEGVFDDFVAGGCKLSADFKPVSVMRSMNIAPQMTADLRLIWQRRLTEFETVQAGKDPQLVEGYRFTKVQLRNCVKFCETVIEDCGAYVQIKKVERKPRKVKPVSPEKRAAKFKICAEFAELKLKSLPAAQLVDKSEAWLYDTKKRKLIHVVADEYAKAFTVKNNAIIGYSTAETQQKTLRKPAEVLKVIATAGKPAARKVFKDLTTTETQWNGRGTEHVVILRAW